MQELVSKRAHALRRARAFFEERGIQEVDCPALCRFASVDEHIDLFEVHTKQGGVRYLHSSPEYGMKRLLAAGCSDIYQLAHVFRDEPASDKHNPEFMMAEWYRIHFSFEDMIEETLAFIKLFLGDLPVMTLSYRRALMQYASIDYVQADEDDLLEALRAHRIYPHTTKADLLLNILMGSVVEPQLSKLGLVVLLHYPETQAALAQVVRLEDGERVAKRFEIYGHGLELANGYLELCDLEEQKKRLLQSNRLREKPLPIDESFLQALPHLPPCAGVAAGFDRLLLLQEKASHLHRVLPLTWNLA